MAQRGELGLGVLRVLRHHGHLRPYTEVRIKKNIYGSTLEDFFTTLCMPNMVISQLAYESGGPQGSDGAQGIPI